MKVYVETDCVTVEAGCVTVVVAGSSVWVVVTGLAVMVTVEAGCVKVVVTVEAD